MLIACRHCGNAVATTASKCESCGKSANWSLCAALAAASVPAVALAALWNYSSLQRSWMVVGVLAAVIGACALMRFNLRRQQARLRPPIGPTQRG